MLCTPFTNVFYSNLVLNISRKGLWTEKLLTLQETVYSLKPTIIQSLKAHVRFCELLHYISQTQVSARDSLTWFLNSETVNFVPLAIYYERSFQANPRLPDRHPQCVQ